MIMSKAGDPRLTTESGTDDAWKDELLAKPYISGLELMQMSEEHRQWMGQHGHVWHSSPNEDGCYNLLHRDNAHMVERVQRWREACRVADDAHKARLAASVKD